MSIAQLPICCRRYFPRIWPVVLWPAVVCAAFLFWGLCGTAAAAGDAGGEIRDRISPKQCKIIIDDPQLIAPDFRRILESGHLVVAVLKSDAPPFVLEDKTGKRSGLDVELLQGFAERFGLTITYSEKADTFEDLVKLVANNQADLSACGVSRTLYRTMYVNFTRPYLKLHQGLLINRLELAKHVHVHSWNEVIKDLNGTLGVLAGSSYVWFARLHLTGMQLVLFPSIEDIRQAVLERAITAAYLDELDIKMFIRARPDQVLRCQTILFKDVPDHIAFPVARKNPQLLRLLNLYLEAHPNKLTIDQILDKYLPAVTGDR